MSSPSGKGKEKTTFNPEIPPYEGFLPSSPPAVEATPFSPHTSLKRPRSNTTTSLRDYVPGLAPKQYWNQRLMEERKKKSGKGEFSIHLLTTLLVDFVAEVHQDYSTKCDQLSEHINTLQDENATMAAAINALGEKTTHFLGSSPTPEDTSLRQEVGSFRSHTLRELKELNTTIKDLERQQNLQMQQARKAAGSTPAPSAQPPPPPPPPPPAAPMPGPSSWAQVARKGKKKTPATPAKPTPAVAPAQQTPKAPSPKKGPTLRERRLLVKRDGTPLTTSVIAIRDSINSALNAVLIQRVECNASNDLLFTTMDTVRATSLNSKISQFLHLIPGTTTVQLDSPSAQLLVHGIPTSYSLADIGKELTTFNTGLALAQQPRWLCTDEQRAAKRASTIVITITGPKAQDFAILPHLSAFSTTFRLERRLRFGPTTQCYNCHQFGHHTLKCTRPATCRWCAKRHPTGEHTCPTASCMLRGRLCAHASPLCTNCHGPHEAHSTTCTKRPAIPKRPSEEDEELEGVQMVGS
jgi:hypothetical protein